MFRKVRLRTTVYQLAVIAAVLLVVFAVSCVFNYERMLRDISDNLSVIEKIGMGTQPGETSGRKGVTVKVYEDNHYKASTNDFYDEETIKKIVYTITEGEGRTNLDGKYIAYKVNESDNYYLIYVYDYSEDYKAFVSDLVMILLIGLSTMAVVALFITIFTKPI